MVGTIGTSVSETSVRAAYHFNPYSILYRGDVIRDKPGLVDLPQGLGRYFPMAGVAIADICLVLR
jgi:hypothetical protein